MKKEEVYTCVYRAIFYIGECITYVRNQMLYEIHSEKQLDMPLVLPAHTKKSSGYKLQLWMNITLFYYSRIQVKSLVCIM